MVSKGATKIIYSNISLQNCLFTQIIHWRRSMVSALRRAIAEAKQWWSVIGWVTKN
jgi:hypothetical protein